MSSLKCMDPGHAIEDMISDADSLVRRSGDLPRLILKGWVFTNSKKNLLNIIPNFLNIY